MVLPRLRLNAVKGTNKEIATPNTDTAKIAEHVRLIAAQTTTIFWTDDLQSCDLRKPQTPSDIL